MSVRENLIQIRASLEKIGRAPVRIVGVTKFQPVERVREAVDAGVGILANNYAQEGKKLRECLGDPALEWHFIGHIQSRKVKYLIHYDCVQSLDRVEVASALQERVQGPLSVLVEVNIGAEPQKSGILATNMDFFLKELARFPRLRVRGIMGMPPPVEPVEGRRPFFKALRTLYDRYQSSFGFDCLSMGTSDDYLIAAEEGSTMVRLGQVLFGARPLGSALT